jgi:haloacetate dehalogenase
MNKELSNGTIFAKVEGSGPPLLLLHGFPETHIMWRDITPVLAKDFTVVCADLRGYGASHCPPSMPDLFRIPNAQWRTKWLN